MTRIIIHMPTETEMARTRMGGQFARMTMDEVIAILNRNRTREAYGCTENTITLIVPGRNS
jgi:hypothetical protein